MKHDVFISYRRDGGEYTAKILRDSLHELGYKVFFDVESLRSGYFNTKLYTEIENCQDFILILSPNALDRCKNEGDWVRLEVEHALACGKNIVPIMLRGFSFPNDLPESMKDVPNINGLEATPQFYEAFIEKLQEFLKSKPPLWRRIKQNVVFQKSLPLILALLVLSVAIGGISFAKNAWSNVYPRTAQEKNLTGEVIYYVSSHLTNINILAGAMEDVLTAAEQYLILGDTSEVDLQNEFDHKRDTMESIEAYLRMPTDDFLKRLEGTEQFPISEVKAMYDAVEQFQKGCIKDLEYIEYVVSPDFVFSKSDKLEIINCYQTMLEEEVKLYANATNSLLLPITNKDALEELHYKILPQLSNIPLDVSNWEEDKEVLDLNYEKYLANYERAMNEFGSLVGDSNIEAATAVEAMILSYMHLGYTREEAENIVEKERENEKALNNIRETCRPEEGDSMDKLWVKIKYSMTFDFHEEALECLAALEEAAQDDPYAEQYIPAMRKFIESIPETGIDYGVIVTAYDETGSHEVIEIGDMIISFNGEPCYNRENYAEKKKQLTQEQYTVEVLRFNEDKKWEIVSLELTMDMPLVGITDVTKKYTSNDSE